MHVCVCLQYVIQAVSMLFVLMTRGVPIYKHSHVRAAVIDIRQRYETWQLIVTVLP